MSKTFADARVLSNVDLKLRHGEVRGLIGHNGSGKSTLIKILAGFHAPDAGGLLEVNGQRVPLPMTTKAAEALGLRFVHQDLALVESGSVLENLRLRHFDTGVAWRISWARERRVARKILGDFGLDIDPDSPIGSLSPVEKTMVAVVRAIQSRDGRGAVLLVLDEPTAYLPRDKVEQVFDTIRRVSAQGHGVLFVSHRLDEVREIATTVTVLRDGHVVADVDTKSTSERELVSLLVGAPLEDFYAPTRKEAAAEEEELVFEATNVSRDGVERISFAARAGEVLGLTGLAGSAQEWLPYAVFGALPGVRGEVRIGDRRHRLGALRPRTARQSGLALLPTGRSLYGGVAGASVGENVTLLELGRFVRTGVLRHSVASARAAEWLREFDVIPPDESRLFGSLSGGNQQKALLAKWFAGSPKVFLMHEPAHGVDVGAKPHIFHHIQRAAARGVTVVISSVEAEDLVHLCDRVIVFRRRSAPVELFGAALTKERLVEQSYG